MEIKRGPCDYVENPDQMSAKNAGTTPEALRAAVEGNASYRMRIGYLAKGMVIGNPIAYFFVWNGAVPYDAGYRHYWLKSSSSAPGFIEELASRLA